MNTIKTAIRAKVWRITEHGRHLYAVAEFPTEEKALEWAVERLIELFKRGSIGSIQVDKAKAIA